LDSFESPSGVETTNEISVSVGASQKVKCASEAFVANQSLIDRASETEDILRWEGERAWASDRLIAGEGRAMKKTGRGIEDLNIWGRDGREGIGSS
jgi:hypothetical protein